MQVLFLMWLALAGMKDVLWEGGLEPAAAAAEDTTTVDAAEGPVFPPKP
jgi:hypothetical protein